MWAPVASLASYLVDVAGPVSVAAAGRSPDPRTAVRGVAPVELGRVGVVQACVGAAGTSIPQLPFAGNDVFPAVAAASWKVLPHCEVSRRGRRYRIIVGG